MDVMWGAQQVAWWASQRSCYELDLLGERMHEYRHLIACIIDALQRVEPVHHRTLPRNDVTGMQVSVRTSTRTMRTR